MPDLVTVEAVARGWLRQPDDAINWNALCDALDDCGHPPGFWYAAMLDAGGPDWLLAAAAVAGRREDPARAELARHQAATLLLPSGVARWPDTNPLAEPARELLGVNGARWLGRALVDWPGAPKVHADPEGLGFRCPMAPGVSY